MGVVCLGLCYACNVRDERKLIVDYFPLYTERPIAETASVKSPCNIYNSVDAMHTQQPSTYVAPQSRYGDQKTTTATEEN
jgi:hypothetical protein